MVHASRNIFTHKYHRERYNAHTVYIFLTFLISIPIKLFMCSCVPGRVIYFTITMFNNPTSTLCNTLQANYSVGWGFFDTSVSSSILSVSTSSTDKPRERLLALLSKFTTMSGTELDDECSDSESF